MDTCTRLMSLQDDLVEVVGCMSTVSAHIEACEGDSCKHSDRLDTFPCDAAIMTHSAGKVAAMQCYAANRDTWPNDGAKPGS